MDTLGRLPAMDREWRAWRVLCEFLANYLDINIDSNDTLCRAIEVWGEELAALRRTQPPEVVGRVLEEKRALVAAKSVLRAIERSL